MPVSVSAGIALRVAMFMASIGAVTLLHELLRSANVGVVAPEGVESPTSRRRSFGTPFARFERRNFTVAHGGPQTWSSAWKEKSIRGYRATRSLSAGGRKSKNAAAARKAVRPSAKDSPCPEQPSSYCWLSVSHHLVLQGNVDDRCPQRRVGLCDAQRACEDASTWCGGITRDNGLACGPTDSKEVMRFELRAGGAMPRLSGSNERQVAKGPTSWMMLPRPSTAPSGGANACAVYARRQQCYATLRTSELRARLAALGESDWGGKGQLQARLLRRSAAHSERAEVSCDAVADPAGAASAASRLSGLARITSGHLGRFASQLAPAKGSNSLQPPPPIWQARRKTWRAASGETRCNGHGEEGGDGCDGRLPPPPCASPSASPLFHRSLPSPPHVTERHAPTVERRCAGHLCFLGRCLCSPRGKSGVACDPPEAAPRAPKAAVAPPSASLADLRSFCARLPVDAAWLQSADGLYEW